MEKLNRINEYSSLIATGIPIGSLLLSCLICVPLYFSSSDAMGQTTTDAPACDALATRWDEGPGLGSRLDRAKALEYGGKACIGNGIYDLTLAFLYMDGGDLNSADRIAKQGIKRGSPFQANLHQVLAETTLLRGDVDAAYKAAEDIAKKNPTYVPILAFLLEIDIKNQNWITALPRAQKWHAIDKSAASLLVMAAVLHQLNRHEECVAMVYKALIIDPARIAKIDGLKEAVFSLGVLKRNEEAAQLLRRHIQANPSWAQDASMVNAAKALGLTK